jgi:hypothetical protein
MSTCSIADHLKTHKTYRETLGSARFKVSRLTECGLIYKEGSLITLSKKGMDFLRIQPEAHSEYNLIKTPPEFEDRPFSYIALQFIIKHCKRGNSTRAHWISSSMDAWRENKDPTRCTARRNGLNLILIDLEKGGWITYKNRRVSPTEKLHQSIEKWKNGDYTWLLNK